MLRDEVTLRSVEPNIFSVLPTDESGNEYDSKFGFVYDLIACNPIYNRLIWGYSIKIFQEIADEALRSSFEGYVLDLACGSLAFTAKIYGQRTDRPAVLVDQSLKMLRMAKSRLMKQNGNVPENLVFLHSDALHLPFQKNTFTTIISENLLHCLHDTGPLLKQLQDVITRKGRIYFTTLIRNHRWADKYLEGLASSGKLISRAVNDHTEKFQKFDFAVTYETVGNLLVIKCEK
ncbi:MAG: class I SAM-dependent methyltransferase [Desulfobacterales bacterium]|nr:class I SAM-dependent methyltransferase [Desulfobacterales bacterium]